MTRVWRIRDGELPVGARTLLMGVVNVTPDSFSDGGRHASEGTAVAHALGLLREGADILDVGGESTRPGAAPVPADEEARRVLPVVRRLVAAGARVSVDTSKAGVAAQALAEGAHVVNDVTAGRDPNMLRVVARAGAGLVLMHMQGEPRTMQQAPRYDDVVKEVAQFLIERARAAEAAGVARESIALDPGIGFGKALEHNLALLRHLDELRRLGYPLLVGASRKQFIGALTKEGDSVPSPVDRLEGTLAAHLAA
ncbi:MAG TPA: dihydropteroate synthase, partial [Candidatus Thermoplasmatota archaeon]|nr:dihydropteroate synthase [Candidatus Thermoplasmatota archaeon]